MLRCVAKGTREDALVRLLLGLELEKLMYAVVADEGNERSSEKQLKRS
ncbi:MAG TPA: hypothetical protein VD907_03225 [Verrucomicrobiae bacterium]|nr:hypothetical protein [Verrucomicrobiae bacterium]